MRTTSIVTTMAAATVLATAFGSLASASTADPRCSGATPGSATASSVARSLEELGYRVDQVEAKYGCWKVEAMNDSNIPIEALYDGSGELLAAHLDKGAALSTSGLRETGAEHIEQAIEAFRLEFGNSPGSALPLAG